MKAVSFLASAALLLVVACNNAPTEQKGNTKGNVMNATVDGLAVNATTVTAIKSGNRIFITGTGAFRTITLTMAAPSGPGEVFLTLDDAVNTALIAEGTPPNNPVWSTALVPRDTSSAQFSIVNFSSVTSAGVSGSFFLKAGPASAGAIGLRYGNGTFDVKF